MMFFSFKKSFLIPIHQTLNKLPRSVFIAIVMGVYVSVGLMGVFHHELWRDEANVWLHAWGAGSWDELTENISYDGHPWLWYILVYGLLKLTQNPIAMQVFHLGIAAIFIYLILRYAPFSRLYQLLFCVGYYGGYEYAWISRNYALGVLGIFLFCAAFETRRRTYLGLAVSVAVMMQANIYAAILAIAALMALGVDAYLYSTIQSTPQRWIDGALSGLIVGVVGWLSLDQMIPSQAANYASGWVMRWDGMRALEALSKITSSYLLLITPQRNFWDFFLFAIASLILFSIFVRSLYCKPVALVFYTVATLGILAFSYFKFMGATRHVGHLMIALIAALWLADHYPDSEDSFAPNSPRLTLPSMVLTVILSSQAIAGFFAIINDFRYPFSASKATAAYLQTEQLDQSFLVGSPDYAMASISLHLQRQIYYPETQKLGSFTRFTTDRIVVDHPALLQQMATLLRTQSRSELILIVNQPLITEHPDLCIQPLTEFTESLIHDEVFYLYRVQFRCAAALTLP